MWNSKNQRVTSLFFVFCLYLFVFTRHVWATEEYVTVGDAKNPPCSLINAGSVNYVFEIKSTEVTNREYCEFLNSVARNSDSLNLYSPLMDVHFWGGIFKTINENGTYNYYCKKGYCNYPVVFVSWSDSIRYINWLHYGKPNNGNAELGTTEGNSLYGAYNTMDFNNDTRAYISCKKRNPNAVYWLPNRDEWIKAGFYDGKGSYYRYATQANSIPLSVPPSEKSKNAANYYANHWANPFPHLSEVGSYVNAKSFYGTYDQAGNIMEWVEDIVAGNRMALGGSLFMYEYALPITYWDGETPGTKLSTFGFRVAKKIDSQIMPLYRQMNEGAGGNDTLGGSEVKSNNINFQGTSFVRVGDPSNPSDYNGFGRVDYDYYIGKYEISNEQYVEFLNAVAASNDPYSLYSDSMGQGVLGGITRQVHEGHYQYKVKDGWGKKPVNYVSWFDIARLANWYHYGKPQGGTSRLGTTEGNATLGAYDTTGFSDIKQVSATATLARNKGAMYFIPNENEWYKAAYYDPQKVGFRKYWDYPMMTDNFPNNKKPPGDLYTANYQVGSTFSEGPPFYLSDVDAYPYALSYYGTSSQGGNVWEWLENWREVPDKHEWRATETVKAVRGGSFGYTEIGLHVRNTDPADPRHKTYVHGARLARAINNNGYQPKTIEFRQQLLAYINRSSKKQTLLIGAIFGSVGLSFFALLAFLLYKNACCKNP
jgi:formylglycine-generating enzyme required for sulfatase activity